jgi:hypothetical protein
MVESGDGGYCPIKLCTHSGHGLPLFSVHVFASVVEGAFGRPALFVTEEEAAASWLLLGVVQNTKAKRVSIRAGKIFCFTIAPSGAAR